jgi:hypothetical protein
MASMAAVEGGEALGIDAGAVEGASGSHRRRSSGGADASDSDEDDGAGRGGAGGGGNGLPSAVTPEGSA